MAIEIEPFYRELGRRIRDRRTLKGLTQEKLGELLDPQVTRASIANIEMGAQRVLAHTLVQLAYHLGTSASELLPSMEVKANGRDENAAIFKELDKKLSLPPKEVEQLLKKLKTKVT